MKTTKTILRNTDKFKANLRNTDHSEVITPNERLCNSPVPCQCSACAGAVAGGTHRPINGPQGPQSAGVELGRCQNSPEQIFEFVKNPVNFERNTVILKTNGFVT